MAPELAERTDRGNPSCCGLKSKLFGPTNFGGRKSLEYNEMALTKLLP